MNTFYEYARCNNSGRIKNQVRSRSYRELYPLRGHIQHCLPVSSRHIPQIKLYLARDSGSIQPHTGNKLFSGSVPVYAGYALIRHSILTGIFAVIFPVGETALYNIEIRGGRSAATQVKDITEIFVIYNVHGRHVQRVTAGIEKILFKSPQIHPYGHTLEFDYGRMIRPWQKFSGYISLKNHVVSRP